MCKNCSQTYGTFVTSGDALTVTFPPRIPSSWFLSFTAFHTGQCWEKNDTFLRFFQNTFQHENSRFIGWGLDPKLNIEKFTVDFFHGVFYFSSYGFPRENCIYWTVMLFAHLELHKLVKKTAILLQPTGRHC